MERRILKIDTFEYLRKHNDRFLHYIVFTLCKSESKASFMGVQTVHLNRVSGLQRLQLGLVLSCCHHEYFWKKGPHVFHFVLGSTNYVVSPISKIGITILNL